MWISKILLVIMASKKYAFFNFGKEIFFAVESKCLSIISIVASYVKSKCRALLGNKEKIAIESSHQND